MGMIIANDVLDLIGLREIAAYLEDCGYRVVDKQKAEEGLDEIKLGMQRLYEAFALGREDAVEMTKVWLADQLGRCVPVCITTLRLPTLIDGIHRANEGRQME